jgi:hypothetical protein
MLFHLGMNLFGQKQQSNSEEAGILNFKINPDILTQKL